ncbi:DUF262 domain-containing protein [Rubrivivax gelatinosus]|uniref:DUF262 domain-containing protein n=1 Tax=Rubrivivax gelatinosus TaxID=28068 RepID=UPI0002F32BD8|nr:DUF262 domain-containing protein [Rubrivivax gelatinosus]MBG6083177.1 hypothetical protein [Rubrivivax gelatinosus]
MAIVPERQILDKAASSALTEHTGCVSADHLRIYYGLSPEFWQSLGEKGRAMYALVRPTPQASYRVDVSLHRLRAWVDEAHEQHLSLGGGVELCPDFQRGHVWTEAQRTAFCEAFLRGQAPAALLFNCANFTGRGGGGDLPEHLLQCVDGLQRYTALTDFYDNRVSVFGGMQRRDFDGTPFDARRLRVEVRVHELPWRRDLLELYLNLNGGGTVHSDQELARVRALLEQAGHPTA